MCGRAPSAPAALGRIISVARAVEDGSVTRAVSEDANAVRNNIQSKLGKGDFRAKLARKCDEAAQRVKAANVKRTAELPCSFQDFKAMTLRPLSRSKPLSSSEQMAVLKKRR